MPRPRKQIDLQLKHLVAFRLNDPQFAPLQAAALQAGMTPNELARLLTCKGPHKLTLQVNGHADPALIAQLRHIGVNLNQLVHNAHMFGRVSPKVAELCEQIREIVINANLKDVS